MKKGRRLHNWVISFLLPFLLTLHIGPGAPEAFSLTTKEEQILGRKFMAQIRENFDFVEDDFTREYISDLGQYLVKPLETKRFPFRFHIIKDNNLNAFAGPAGHVFIFSGLIEAADQVDELAAVIGHEIGHVSGRHLAHRIEKTKKIGIVTMAGILASVLIGGKAGGAIATGSVAAGIQAQLHYSRVDERQADQLGFKYMEEAGFDPSAMIRTLKKIQKGQWIGTDRIPPYLLTHPTGPERMSNLDVMLSNYIRKPENREVAGFRARFPFFKTILRARAVEPHEAERLFRMALKEDPDSPLANFGLGIVMMERSEHDLAIGHFRRALKGQPESRPILRNLGKAYQLKGQDDKAITVLEKVLKMDEEDRAALFLLATSYQNLEQYGKAIRLYEKLTSMKPIRDTVFYNLGVSYAREGRMALAHYNFGVYFKRLGKGQKAKFHFQKADELSRNDPALRRRIRKGIKASP